MFSKIIQYFSQVDTNHAIAQAKTAAIDIGSLQQEAYSQPSMLPQNHAKEADIRALTELTRALDKKVIHYNICTTDHRNVKSSQKLMFSRN